jgi:hypothetical protein
MVTRLDLSAQNKESSSLKTLTARLRNLLCALNALKLWQGTRKRLQRPPAATLVFHDDDERHPLEQLSAGNSATQSAKRRTRAA